MEITGINWIQIYDNNQNRLIYINKDKIDSVEQVPYSINDYYINTQVYRYKLTNLVPSKMDQGVYIADYVSVDNLLIKIDQI